MGRAAPPQSCSVMIYRSSSCTTDSLRHPVTGATGWACSCTCRVWMSTRALTSGQTAGHVMVLSLSKWYFIEVKCTIEQTYRTSSPQDKRAVTQPLNACSYNLFILRCNLWLAWEIRGIIQGIDACLLHEWNQKVLWCRVGKL